MQPDRQLCADLRERLEKLTAKDAVFARSLIESVERRGIASPKQAYWLGDLIKRAEKPPASPERVKTAIGGLEGIKALFDKAAASRLKRPAIVIGIAGLAVRLNVAGDRARVPGSINVMGDDFTGVGRNGEPERPWFGRIIESGEFEASPRLETPAGMIDGLTRFAAEPAKVAGEYGRLTGRCCFCNLALTDERSTVVGYGPQCAKHYGLPYPTMSAARAASPLKAKVVTPQIDPLDGFTFGGWINTGEAA